MQPPQSSTPPHSSSHLPQMTPSFLQVVGLHLGSSSVIASSANAAGATGGQVCVQNPSAPQQSPGRGGIPPGPQSPLSKQTHEPSPDLQVRTPPTRRQHCEFGSIGFGEQSLLPPGQANSQAPPE